LKKPARFVDNFRKRKKGGSNFSWWKINFEKAGGKLEIEINSSRVFLETFQASSYQKCIKEKFKLTEKIPERKTVKFPRRLPPILGQKLHER